MKALDRAIEAAGSQAELARRMGGKVRIGHIYYWRRKGVPPGRAVAIEKAVDGIVTRKQLCPKFPWDEQPATKAA